LHYWWAKLSAKQQNTKKTKNKKMAELWRSSEGKEEPAWFSHWSIVHVLSGVALEASFRGRPVGAKLAWCLGIHTMYEAKDLVVSYTVGRNTNDHGWRDNSVENSAGDTLSVACGFYFSHLYLQPVRARLLNLVYLLVLLVEWNRLPEEGAAITSTRS